MSREYSSVVVSWPSTYEALSPAPSTAEHVCARTRAHTHTSQPLCILFHLHYLLQLVFLQIHEVLMSYGAKQCHWNFTFRSCETWEENRSWKALSIPSPKAHEIDAKKENWFLVLCAYTFGHAAHGHEVAVLDTPAPISDEDILYNHSVVRNTKVMGGLSCTYSHRYISQKINVC